MSTKQHRRELAVPQTSSETGLCPLSHPAIIPLPPHCFFGTFPALPFRLECLTWLSITFCVSPTEVSLPHPGLPLLRLTGLHQRPCSGSSISHPLHGFPLAPLTVPLGSHISLFQVHLGRPDSRLCGLNISN